MAVKSRGFIEARIRKLEASMQEAKRKEEQARRLLNEHLNDESASAYSGDLVAIQASIRALDEALVNERSELKKIIDHANSKEGKADQSRIEELLKVHEKLFQAIRSRARELLSTCEELDASLREYDRLALKIGAFGVGQAFSSIRLKSKYSWVRKLEELLSKWLDDEKWLNFKL